MFREIREIREIRKEEKLVNEGKDEKELGYLKIKPEREWTMEEIDAFWEEEFDRIAKES